VQRRSIRAALEQGALKGVERGKKNSYFREKKNNGLAKAQ
jgi:hypothetical protein